MKKTLNSIISHFSLLLIWLLATVSISSCQNKQALNVSNELVLTEAEKTSLLFLREEEKLARDVYLTLHEKWGGNIFQNIAASEQTHTNSVLALIQKFGLIDPVTDDAVGVFKNEDLQNLYHTLVAQGNQSLSQALIVGATIEDLDLYDLQEANKLIQNQDILNVYSNLSKGSRNHLRAFYGKIISSGGEYTPQYISQEDFDAIVNSPKEKGRI